MKVLLVNMPFATIESPSLGLSLLKAKLTEAGVSCDVLYANLAFARAISPEVYDLIVKESHDRVLAGESVFADDVFGSDQERSNRNLQDVFAGMPQQLLDALRHARQVVAEFLAQLSSTVSWNDYDVVGFTSMGDQNLAAMSVAKRIKQSQPGIVIVVGGVNWHGVMGISQLRAFPFVDFACLGEGEEALLALVRAMTVGHEPPVEIPGLAANSHDSGSITGRAAEVAELDSLPLPDFSDYFETLSEVGLESSVTVNLSLQTSRGCSWAELHPCRFCGLCGDIRRYRAKSPERVLCELRAICNQWPGCDITVADNVVPPDFISEVLPALAERPLGVRFFFEARPCLTQGELTTISRTAASIQVGIESLSTHVLQLMRKGFKAIELVRFLRMSLNAGIIPAWNLLYGMPGETDDDYRAIIESMRSIRFLPAPQICTPVSLVRFSPLFESWREYGYLNVRPPAAYRHIYGVPEEVLWNLAHVFDYDERISLVTRAYRYRLRCEVRAWQDAQGQGVLRLHWHHGHAVLNDTRPDAADSMYELDELEAFVYTKCADPHSFSQLFEAATGRFPQEDIEIEIDQVLARFIERQAMVHLDGMYLSLALSEGIDSVSRLSHGGSIKAGRQAAVRVGGQALPSTV